MSRRPEDKLSAAWADHDYAAGYMQAWREWSSLASASDADFKRMERRCSQCGDRIGQYETCACGATKPEKP